MKAIIMAGGHGSRLRPLTCDLPKPMVPVFNKPIMEHIIELLKKHGIVDIGVTLMFLPQNIKDYFGDGSKYGVNLHYFVEETPLGTAGSVKNADEFLDDTFIVISGDGLTDMDLTKAIEFHKQKKSVATLVLYKVKVPLEYGVVVTDENGSITRFLEKPSWSEVFSDTANTGTYILEPEVLDYFEKGQNFDFSKNLFPLLMKDNKPMYGYITSGYWCDIGDLDAYLQSHFDALKGAIKLNTLGSKISSNVWIGAGTEIHPEAVITGPCIIGENCKIGKATIEHYSVIGNNNVIEDNVSIKKSIIWDNNYIQSGSEIRGSILCNRINLKNFVSVFENAVIGDNTTVNERAIIKPNVKIWPEKIIDTLSIVDRNIIWGVKYSKTIFGEDGLSGIVNVDISPEFATRLGAAYGSTFKKGSRVAVSSTSSNAARMFKYAFISGLLSVGVEVYNLSSLLTPIARHAINFLPVNGGIHVKVDDKNSDRICVDIMDEKGASISRTTERNIENSFAREDFKRTTCSDISRIINMPDYNTYYLSSILNEIDVPAVKSTKLKVAIASHSDLVLNNTTIMLREIGCEVISLSNLSESEDEIIQDIKDFVTKDKFNLGVYINTNGEKLIIVDDKGTIISNALFYVLTSVIVFKSINNAKVIAPLTASSIIEKLAQKYNGQVLRTKTSTQAVMKEMLSSNTLKNNRENLLQFILSYDAIGGLLKIIEFMALQKVSLSEIVESIPPFYLLRKNLNCPWDLKGTVMRMLIESNTDSTVETLDGVKFVFEDEWVLILPDAEKPLVKVYAEGNSEERSKEIMDQYTRKIKEIINL